MKEKIVLFGAGDYGVHILGKVEQYFTIQAVCDNNAALWGSLFCGKYPIISAETVVADYSDDKVLVALKDKKNFDTVCRQLSQWNIKCQHINEALFEVCVKNGVLFSVDCEETEILSLYSQQRNIFVLTAPSHSNLGDQAQSYCIESLLRKQYPNSNIFIYDEYRILGNYYELLYVIKQSLRPHDMVLLHSGYRLTNLYTVSHHIVEMMLRLFSDRKMIFLPQTIYYTDEKVKKHISQMINDHVVIMCRDEVSYESAKELFPRSKLVLYPDVVTSLIGSYQLANKRSGILMCLRNADDGESLISHADADGLKKKIEEIGRVTLADTTIEVDWKEIAKNRKYYIDREINSYSKYELVITNRYHGVIFALTANTPVIVLPTSDHKIVAGLKWFEEAGYKGIFFCESIDSILEIARQVVNSKEQICNDAFFYNKYFKNFSLEEFL